MWIEGIGCKVKNVDYQGLNELLTEWLAFNITNIKEPNNIYQKQFKVVCFLKENCDFESIVKNYFQSNTHQIKAELSNIYLFDMDKNINRISRLLKF